MRAEVSAGRELDAAYAVYENRQLKIRLRQMEQNQKNRENVIGSAAGGAGEMADDFLKGFFGM